jgi:DNA-binding winged helix-turn-helix (wHTH) protein
MIGNSEFRLGEWTVQPALNTIRRDDNRVRIEPRYMDLLVHLARHPSEVVGPDVILQKVWSGQIVGDHSVYQGIARLRRALGDSSRNPRYIETVAKRGYRQGVRQRCCWLSDFTPKIMRLGVEIAQKISSGPFYAATR